ncbi:hypothetical protein GCM10011335_42160 [Aureimonas glaciei]|uniref:Uncharacterized protein n=1 Tax=Aureimonas glaciei TaxID=1776957 RepID=A0A916Y948_9HYPH|nr:hypothetical protein GCM10011335_42160 [Aureimonas glaciei]
MILGSPPSPSGTGDALLISADVTALGVDTFASLEIVAALVATSSTQQASASIDASAVGQDLTGQDAAFTVANVDFSGDATVYVYIQQSETSFTQEAESSTSTSSLTIDFFALEILAPGTSGGGAAADPNPDAVTVAPAAIPDPLLIPPPAVLGIDFNIDGNVALFHTEAVAIGDDSFVSIDLAAFTLEDQLSSITAVATLLIA